MVDWLKEANDLIDEKVTGKRKKFLNRHYKKQLLQVSEYGSTNDFPNDVKDQMANAEKNSNPTIIVLYEGGTIGMEDSVDGKIATDGGEGGAMFFDDLRKRGLDTGTVNLVRFPIITPAIDSTNGRWTHWLSAGNAIKASYDNADGYVVVGGTDTMAQQAAAFKFMFKNFGKPLISTCAQYSRFDTVNDALNNLGGGILTAMGDISGSHLVFEQKIMDGMKLKKVKHEDMDAFSVPHEHYMGKVQGNHARIHPHAPKRKAHINMSNLDFDKSFMEGINLYNLSTAQSTMDLWTTAHTPTSAATVAITFGAGNIRNLASYPGEPTHVEIAKELRKKGLPVVLGSPMHDGDVNSTYATGKQAIDEGKAIAAGTATGAALEVKSMYALKKSWNSEVGKVDIDKFEEVINTDVAGELS